MRRRLLWGAAVLLLLVVGWTGFQAYSTYSALSAARGHVQELKRHLLAGDTQAAGSSVDRLQSDGEKAVSSSSGPAWDLMSHLPGLGRDVQAVQVVSAVLDQTARQTLPSALALATSLDGGGLRDEQGRFDLGAIARLEPSVKRLADQSARARDRLDEIDPEALAGPLSTSVGDLQSQVRSLSRASRGGVIATQVLPALLGASGPRTYLLVVQNNAEIRSTGGLPGSFSYVRAVDGKLTLASSGSALEFPLLQTPVLPLTAEEKSLFGTNLGLDVRDTNITPDFPRTAQLITAMAERTKGRRVDGVLSVDPVALAEVMKATGPIHVGSRTYTSDNVVAALLNETYQDIADPLAQDAFFAATAGAIFSSLTTGDVPVPGLVRQLSTATGQGRVLFWSSHASVRRSLAGTRVTGALPGASGDHPVAGIYLSDAAGSKMEYYLRFRGQVISGSCTGSGVQTLTSSVDLRSAAPTDTSTLAPYITGFGQYAPKGDISLRVRVYAPAGGSLSRLEANGRPVDYTPMTHQGHQVALVDVLLGPGDRVILTATMKGPAGQAAAPRLEMTPGIEARDYSSSARTSCG